MPIKSRNKVQDSKGDRLFNTVNISLLAILLLVYVYPIYFIIIASISDPTAIWNGEVILWPKKISFEGYVEIYQYRQLWIGYANSILYTVMGVAINLALTLTAAYVLSCKEFMLRNVLMKLFTFTMFFGGGLIPSYLLVQGLGMLDSMWALIIPGAVSVFNIIITRTFFVSSIPYELKEAAILDGCGHTMYLVRIVLPLSSAIISVIALYYGIGHWNSYFSAMIYLSDRDKFPLQLILREIILRSTSLFESAGDEATLAKQMRLAEVVKYCSILVASIPAMIAYPFVQKSFVKGVMVGSIKG